MLNFKQFPGSCPASAEGGLSVVTSPDNMDRVFIL